MRTVEPNVIRNRVIKSNSLTRSNGLLCVFMSTTMVCGTFVGHHTLVVTSLCVSEQTHNMLLL